MQPADLSGNSRDQYQLQLIQAASSNEEHAHQVEGRVLLSMALSMEQFAINPERQVTEHLSRYWKRISSGNERHQAPLWVSVILTLLYVGLLLTYLLLTALAGKVMRSVVPSVCLSVCFHFIFWTDWPSNLSLCMCVVHDHSSLGIESQGNWSRLKVIVQRVWVWLRGNAVGLISVLDHRSRTVFLSLLSTYTYLLAMSDAAPTAASETWWRRRLLWRHGVTCCVVTSQGHVLWMFPAVIKVYCTLDIRHFPFDDQRCPVIFISWTFNGFKLNVTYNESEPQIIYYRPKNQVSPVHLLQAQEPGLSSGVH